MLQFFFRFLGFAANFQAGILGLRIKEAWGLFEACRGFFGIFYRLLVSGANFGVGIPQ